MSAVRSLLLAVAFLFSAAAATAHALDPGFLDLRAMGGDQWRVAWTVPQSGGQALPMTAVLPENCTPARAATLLPNGTAFRSNWIATCPRGLEGGSIRIEGLEAMRTDVLVRYELVAGSVENRRLTPANPSFVVPLPQGVFGVAVTYVTLGINHILTGIDHLMFVLALILLVRGTRRLMGAITAFTVAHSLSLAAASLGWLVVPAPPVEAIIALSIMVLSGELLRRPDARMRFSETHPWSVSFLFGLLHGLGFARALVDIGLPRGDVPLALLSFNMGVEAGQLLFVAMVILSAIFLRRLYPVVVASITVSGGQGRRILAYGMGSVSASWLIARLAMF